jgi:hypothetical protein
LDGAGLVPDVGSDKADKGIDQATAVLALVELLGMGIEEPFAELGSRAQHVTEGLGVVALPGPCLAIVRDIETIGNGAEHATVVVAPGVLCSHLFTALGGELTPIVPVGMLGEGCSVFLGCTSSPLAMEDMSSLVCQAAQGDVFGEAIGIVDIYSAVSVDLHTCPEGLTTSREFVTRLRDDMNGGDLTPHPRGHTFDIIDDAIKGGGIESSTSQLSPFLLG